MLVENITYLMSNNFQGIRMFFIDITIFKKSERYKNKKNY